MFLNSIVEQETCFLSLGQTEVFAHFVCNGSVRDKDEREIFLSKKAAIKRGQKKIHFRFAEREQVRRSQSCFLKEK
jgi:hypothetical protein